MVESHLSANQFTLKIIFFIIVEKFFRKINIEMGSKPYFPFAHFLTNKNDLRFVLNYSFD